MSGAKTSIILLALVIMGTVFLGGNEKMEQNQDLLIDDFSLDDGLSTWGTRWRMFTDRVMGGVSRGEHAFETINGRRCVHLQGDISLKNNGGFIQVALPLRKKKKRTFNASAYKGVRLWVMGNGETYHVHIRNSKTWLPWQYYGAPFTANGEWHMVEIPFSEFKPSRLKKKFNPRRLKRIAVVAIKKEFHADIAVARIEFYR
jgi:hypothetical protein